MSKRTELLIFAAGMVVFAALIMNLVVFLGGSAARAITPIAIVVVGSSALLAFYELRERNHEGGSNSRETTPSDPERPRGRVPSKLFPHLMFLLGLLIFLAAVGALQWIGLIPGRVALAIDVVALPFIVWFASRLPAKAWEDVGGDDGSL